MTLTDSRGRNVALGTPLGRGGEARVYSVSTDASVAAKIYHSPSTERASKLPLMVAAPPSDPTAAQGHVSICWPTALLFDRRRVNVGFLMHRVDFASNVPVFSLYNPRDRQQVALAFTWQYLLRAATNLASVIEAIHSGGYIVGDLNESNILVANTAMVTVVDCDSMQVPQPGTGSFFRCPVGKPEYTPPELQGLDFGRVDRTQSHDNFSLGVLLFQLLMEGNHPFGGVWHGSGDPPPLEERIRIGASPYAGAKLVRPAPGAPPFDILGQDLRTLFRRCFKDGQVSPPARPGPREWRQALVAAEAALVTCARSKRHVHAAHLASCPWCARTQSLGFDPFPMARRTRKRPQAKPPTAPPGMRPLPAIGMQPPAQATQPGVGPAMAATSPTFGGIAAIVAGILLLILFIATFAVPARNRAAAERERAAAAEAADRVQAAEAIRVAERARVERDLPGDWLNGSARLANRPARRRIQEVADVIPAHIHTTHRIVLANWLLENPEFRPATALDYPYEIVEDLLYMRQTYDNEDPYYVAADFNLDTHVDFAVVMIDGSKEPDQTGYTALLVFDGPMAGDTMPTLFEQDVGSPSWAVLFYTEAETLRVGAVESHKRFIYSRGQRYVVEH